VSITSLLTNHRSVGVVTGYFGPIRVVYREIILITLLPCVSRALVKVVDQLSQPEIALSSICIE